MPQSLRCRVTGCDLDPCGVCKRCGEDRQARHEWQDDEREKPCYRRQTCERCSVVKQSPDHDWQTQAGTAGMDPKLDCSRCGLEI